MLKNLTNEEYHAGEGISNSGLNLIICNPYKYWHQYLSGEYNYVQKESHKFGTLIHTMLLEPEEFDNRYFVQSDDFKIDRRSNAGKEAWKEYLTEVGDKEIITTQTMNIINQIKKTISLHDQAKKLLLHGKAEQSIFWTDKKTKVLCKARPDFMNEYFIVEIKTTSSLAWFNSSYFKYGYYRQAAMQVDAAYALDGIRRKHFILAIEKESPYVVDVFYSPQEILAQGRREYREALRTYKKCKKQGVWPSYKEAIKVIYKAA